MMAAAPLWGVTAGRKRNSDDGSYSTPVVQHFAWSQICQRWAINTLIAVIVLTLLTLLVTYFGDKFSLENNRIYFIILLVSLFAIALVISALFCTNRRKAPPDQQKPSSVTQAAKRQQGEGVAHDYNINSDSAVNDVAVDM